MTVLIKLSDVINSLSMDEPQWDWFSWVNIFLSKSSPVWSLIDHPLITKIFRTLTVGALNQTSGQRSSTDVTQQLRYLIYSDYCWRILTKRFCHSLDSLSQNYWIFSRFSSDVFVCWCWFCTAVYCHLFGLMTDVREVSAVLQPDRRSGVPATHLPGLTVSWAAVSLDGNQQLHCNIPTGTTCLWLTELTLTLS